MQLILASQSVQRAKLVATLPYDFQLLPANINETTIIFKNVKDKAKKIALAKAKKVAEQTKEEAIIVAADTFCVCRGKILEKPRTKAEARAMLNWQNNSKIEAITGYAFIWQKAGQQEVKSGVVLVKARFRHLSRIEIENYITNQAVLTWSAAFSPAYDAGMALISSVEGNLTAFTHGLPIDLLSEFLTDKIK